MQTNTYMHYNVKQVFSIFLRLDIQLTTCYINLLELYILVFFFFAMHVML